jgi:hypothetical protein
MLATSAGTPPVVQVWTRKTVLFSSGTFQKPDPPLRGIPDPDGYQFTHGFCRIWLDPSVPIFGSAFGVFHSWLLSDILLLIEKDRCLYIVVIFELFGSL